MRTDSIVGLRERAAKHALRENPISVCAQHHSLWMVVRPVYGGRDVAEAVLLLGSLRSLNLARARRSLARGLQRMPTRVGGASGSFADIALLPCRVVLLFPDIEADRNGELVMAVDAFPVLDDLRLARVAKLPVRGDVIAAAIWAELLVR